MSADKSFQPQTTTLGKQTTASKEENKSTICRTKCILKQKNIIILLTNQHKQLISNELFFNKLFIF